jgi:TRAP-type C4-dicarboxylate transport system permease small subunit
MSASSAGQKPEQHLIHVEDVEVEIEHHPEDWLAFALFWALAFIVFLQFFTRYVLNDSLAWTEEIARYGLMCITFIGGAMVTRRNSHIAVVLLPNLLPAGAGRVLLALVDLITLGFLGLLAYFSVLIVERMQVQRMTVIDLSMSYVYGVIAFGCFLMLARQMQRVFRNMRDGWKSAHDALTAGLVSEPEAAKQ